MYVCVCNVCVRERGEEERGRESVCWRHGQYEITRKLMKKRERERESGVCAWKEKQKKKKEGGRKKERQPICHLVISLEFQLNFWTGSSQIG